MQPFTNVQLQRLRIRVRQSGHTTMKQFMSFIRFRHECVDFSRVSHARNRRLCVPTQVGHW